jgi:DNA mismatch endonuclease (patch repair protein)
MPTFGMPDHPGPSSERMSRRMSGQARRDTQPELAVRRALHAAGLRYRVAYPVPGLPRRTIDIAFPRRRVAVFIDGCFCTAAQHTGPTRRATAPGGRRRS